MPDHSPLARFHPLVRHWFESRLGRPTTIQCRAWPLIAGRSHVLITAPTGSGKTLAAFLWALDQLIGGRVDTGSTRILYVSPLKALNNDVRRNLIRPLGEIRRLFDKNGTPFPEIRVGVRSGDTPASERRQMVRRPPEILITTPESLHLLAASKGGRSVLGDLRTVILDEIHSVAGGKRGTLLMTAVERLVPLSGEFQRIILSATVKPARTVAALAGGYTIDGDPADPRYLQRPVAICRSNRRSDTVVQVRIPDAVMAADTGRSVWDDLAAILKDCIAAHRSTLIFTDSRKMCEKLTFMINSGHSRPVAYAHHGSLSRELRLDVERRLKQGELKAIVATATLELGIDIGALDQVILVKPPASISSAVQRIGRSGHAVGETSLASVYPTHAVDALTAAVLAEAVMETDIEPLRPVECPLDVLAQVLVAMAGTQVWRVDDLFNTVRTAYPFRHLTRPLFDLVIEMLAGRYAGTRIPALGPKIAFDRVDNTISSRKGALLTLYASGGVIPDRGYFTLRRQETGAQIGELDEEFVWEARKGQVFTLGTQNWRIERITHGDVLVTPAGNASSAAPFWRAENLDRDFYLSDKIARFLETAQERMADVRFVDALVARYRMDEKSARFLIDFLRRQQQATGSALPHRHHVLLEDMPLIGSGAGGRQVVIHTFWGGRVNRPFSLALAAAWEKRHGHAPSVIVTNDAVHLLLSQTDDLAEMMTWVSSRTVESLLKAQLESSGVFGARFRECAARALLLPRRRFNQRMPLWVTRQRSQRLLDAVRRFSDFPILLETWRTCLKDDFDMSALVRVLDELESGQIAWSVVRTQSPSPMARAGAWQVVNQFMYADDRPPGRVESRTVGDLIDQVIFTPELRPVVDKAVVTRFQEKRQRLHPGYAPDSPLELLEWVKERALIPYAEWRLLLERIVADGADSIEAALGPIREKLLRLVPERTDGGEGSLIVAAEMAAAVAAALYAGRPDIRWENMDGTLQSPPSIHQAAHPDDDPQAAAVIGQWLRFYGPVSPDFICTRLALGSAYASSVLADLIETRVVITGRLVRGKKTQQICDADNFDVLLRMARRHRRPAVRPRPIRDLTLFMADFQGLTQPGESAADLADCMQRLSGLALPAGLWETDILPARICRYDPEWLDRLIHDSALMWVGHEGRRVAFSHPDDIDLMGDAWKPNPAEADTSDADAADATALFPDHRGRYRLADLLGDPPKPVDKVLKRLWRGVWAGRVTNDGLAVLRSAVANGFKYLPEPAGRSISSLSRSMARSRRHARQRAGRLMEASVGNWYLIPRPVPAEGLVEKEELVKDRVRLLLDRYGILFRELLTRELPAFQWPAIFRSLRLMELAGEVFMGGFFEGIPGLQFASRRMLERLRVEPSEDAVYWMNAKDPASLCGLGIEALRSELPRRTDGTHLVYLGSRLVMVSRRNGKDLRINLPSDHYRLTDCFVVFDHLLGRRFDPLRSLSVASINGEAAPASPYLEALRQRFDVSVEPHAVSLYRPVA